MQPLADFRRDGAAVLGLCSAARVRRSPNSEQRQDRHYHDQTGRRHTPA